MRPNAPRDLSPPPCGEVEMPKGVSREAFRVVGFLRARAPYPKLLAFARSQFRPPRKGKAIWITCLIAVVLALIAAVPATAAEITPFDLYKAGRYEDAIKAGEAANTGQGLALAARAAFAEANLSEMPCLPCLDRVENYARRSIALDTAHPDAFIYLAAALGYKARIVGSLTAQLRRYPELSREAIDHALSV